MDLTLSPALAAFQQEVRAFIKEKLPADIKAKVDRGQLLGRDDYIRWQKILYEKGWIAPGWPQENGGPGFSPIEKYIFDDETGKAGCPRLIPFGLNMVGPVIIAFGTEEQKQQHLPKILSSDVWWCQGYSEPGAGSDLAGLKTRAVRDGDHYIVNGQKTWTTMAQYADWIFCLVRTNPDVKKQEGISFLLIDMDDPGITVKPIITMDGDAEVNEVYFDNVRVPVANLVGEENKGWTVAKYLLGHERTGIADAGRSKHQFNRLLSICRQEQSNGAALIADARFRDKLAELEADIAALDMTVLRMVTEAGDKPPGPEASLLKLRGTEVQQAITELTLEAVGYYGFPFVPEARQHGWNEAPIGPDYAAPVAPHYFNWRKASIYGGSNEVQRGIIAKMVLGF